MWRVATCFVSIIACLLFATACKDKNDNFFDKISIRGIRLGASVSDATRQKGAEFHGVSSEKYPVQMLTLTSDAENYKVDGLQMADVFYKFHDNRLYCVLFVFPWPDAEQMISMIKKRIDKFQKYPDGYKVVDDGASYVISCDDETYIAEFGDNIILVMSKDDGAGKLTIADKKDFLQVIGAEEGVRSKIAQGFRGIKWGQDLHSIPGTFYDTTFSTRESNLKVLKKKDEYMQFGGAYTRSIEYRFWKNQFFEVDVILDQYALKNFKIALAREYGDVIQEAESGAFLGNMGRIKMYCRQAFDNDKIFIFSMTDTEIEAEMRASQSEDSKNREAEKLSMPTGF